MTWVKGKAGVARWVGELEPGATPKPVKVKLPRREPRTGSCVDCGTGIVRRSTRCKSCHGRHLAATSKGYRHANEYDPQELMDILARNLAATPRIHTCHCGCLLTHPEESCPNCLVWATRNANDWSWRTAA